jgi:FlaA1/EpsC-like NDP-sugar epimerase
MTSSRSATFAARMAGLRADRVFAGVDFVLIVASYLFLAALHRPQRSALVVEHVMVVVVVAVIAHLTANAARGLYGRVWRHASIDEARRLVAAGASVSVLTAILIVGGISHVRLSVAVSGPAIATFLMGISRFRSRLFAWQRDGGEPGRTRVAVIGAGDAAASAIREMRWDSSSGMRAVIVLDDDPDEHGRFVMGVPVVGGIDVLPKVLSDDVVDEILLAVSGPSPELVARVADAADVASVPMKIRPGLRDRVAGEPSSRQIRDVQIEDLLGRTPVDTDFAAVASLVAGRSVLVTGAGGSIGSEIVRQLAGFEPAQLVLVDHDETLLHDAMESISGRGEGVLADIRDAHSMSSLFARCQPDIVFHAAALKHVPILERHPLEAVRTNVIGTMNVIDAAVESGVERFVFISSDKAVRPVSVLGMTKWLGEQIVINHASGLRSFCSVRFGNVLGSRGSVVPTFRRQIAAGGPVTVTSPEMTRFFMSVEEAVALVLQASVFAEGADMFMLEMGTPVSIYALARRMIRLSLGPDAAHEIPIVFTGMRPGEKSEEELHLGSEVPLPTDHPSIRRLMPAAIPANVLAEGLERLRFSVERRSDRTTLAALSNLATWKAPSVIDLTESLDRVNRELA